MTAKQRRRIYKLAAFLGGPVAVRESETGKKKFYMSTYATGRLQMPDNKIGLDEPHCGTTGCGLGWATVVFPKSLEFGGYGVVPTDGSTKDPIEWSMDFFGMTRKQVLFAFYAGWDRTAAQEAMVLYEIANGEHLNEEAVKGMA